MREVLRDRDFVRYQAARFAGTIGIQSTSVAIGWQVYELTHDALHLGYVGLAQFVPMMLLALPAGQVADRVDRRRLLAVCYAGFGLGAAALLAVAWLGVRDVRAIYAVLVALGAARAFAGPAASALLPEIVPREKFSAAVALNSSTWQIATIVGPSAGGAAYAWGGPRAAFGLALSLMIATVVLFATMRVRSAQRTERTVTLESLAAGVRYVVGHRVLLGVISLDLFAVLLGGAVALLPAVANDILRVGPVGLGVLRSAPAVGAAAMALWLARFPIERRAGRAMLSSVAVFGVATIVFGLSQSFALSLAALVVVGAADMISVYVRQTLVQIRTPDEVRGRVSAVSFMFIGASNELGELESGVTAKWLGVARAIVVGGIGTLAVVGAWALVFPALRRVDRLVERDE